MTWLLHVSGERYILHDDPDAEACRAEIVAAVHAGGAFVHLLRHNGDNVDVLVTSHTPISMEHLLPPDPGTDPEDDPYFPDQAYITDHDWLP
ncbi:hypothetical protein ACEXQE_02615 [Herbiconiux sp. P17]|uniref:hypothetical protein n=1 Tax=Herbiconiux wuyangfengii TaxID=3342794 RepID=UPI0035BAEAF2